MKKNSAPRRTTDGMKILRRRYLEGRPDREVQLSKVRADDAVGRQIYKLRTKAGLSQRELAIRVGTTASVICRLEDADYKGHSLAMLHRVAAALNREIQISFISKKRAA